MRDLSVAVDADDDAEDLGDRVRDALGDDADAVEAVAVLSTTPLRRARRRPRSSGSASSPTQKNVLVRVVLRHLDRTLTDDEANGLRDRIYAALHRGSAHQWAASCASGAARRGGGACCSSSRPQVLATNGT